MEVTIEEIPDTQKAQEISQQVSVGIVRGWNNLHESTKQLVEWVGIKLHPTDTPKSRHIFRVNIKIDFELCIDDVPLTMKVPIYFMLDCLSGADIQKHTADMFTRQVNLCLARICKSLKDKEHELSFLLPGLK